MNFMCCQLIWLKKCNMKRNRLDLLEKNVNNKILHTKSKYKISCKKYLALQNNLQLIYDFCF